MTVHATGGHNMIQSAVEGMRSENPNGGILAVTVLTSLDQDDLSAAGMNGDPSELALRLSEVAARGGAEGVVCSPHEVAAISEALPHLTKVTPGVRPQGSSRDDQKRIATPEAALAAGADLLVIGRAITRAEDPAEAARSISTRLATIS